MLEHARQHRLGHQKHACDVDAHQPVPLLQRRLQERLDDDCTCVIEEHVWRADRSRNGCDRCIDFGFIGNVSFRKNCRAAGRLNFCDDSASGVLVAIDNADFGTLRRE